MPSKLYGNGENNSKGHMTFRFGNVRYVLNSKWAKVVSVVFAIIGFLVFCMFSFGVKLTNMDKLSKFIRSDYAHFAQLIENAEKDPDLVKTGKVTQCIYDEEYDRWRFKYEVNIGYYGRLKETTTAIIPVTPHTPKPGRTKISTPIRTSPATNRMISQ